MPAQHSEPPHTLSILTLHPSSISVSRHQNGRPKQGRSIQVGLSSTLLIALECKAKPTQDYPVPWDRAAESGSFLLARSGRGEPQVANIRTHGKLVWGHLRLRPADIHTLYLIFCSLPLESPSVCGKSLGGFATGDAGERGVGGADEHAVGGVIVERGVAGGIEGKTEGTCCVAVERGLQRAAGGKAGSRGVAGGVAVVRPVARSCKWLGGRVGQGSNRSQTFQVAHNKRLTFQTQGKCAIYYNKGQNIILRH